MIYDIFEDRQSEVIVYVYSFQGTRSHGNGKVLVCSGIGGPMYPRDRINC